MSNIKLGKLSEVEVRDLWAHEQYDFSEWMSQDENLEQLNEAVGLSICDLEKEVLVGAYRCDLVGKDEFTGAKVIIENQLEQSNHEHLGKTITYASGLGANVIIWVVKEAREEHRSAIEWLNNNTNQNIYFFLIEIHAYKIGDSLPAPKFEVVEKPNDFIKNSKKQSLSEELNKSQSERLEFWTKFNEILLQRGKPFNTRKATTDHWYCIAIGTSEAYVVLNLINKTGQVIIELLISDNQPLFDALEAQKESIEADMGLTLNWEPLPNKKASSIRYSIPGLNFDDHSNYEDLMNEMISKGTLFRDVFRKYVKKLL